MTPQPSTIIPVCFPHIPTKSTGVSFPGKCSISNYLRSGNRSSPIYCRRFLLRRHQGWKRTTPCPTLATTTERIIMNLHNQMLSQTFYLLLSILQILDSCRRLRLILHCRRHLLLRQRGFPTINRYMKIPITTKNNLVEFLDSRIRADGMRKTEILQ